MKRLKNTIAAMLAVMMLMSCFTSSALAVDAEKSQGDSAVMVEDRASTRAVKTCKVSDRFVQVIESEVRNKTVYVDVHWSCEEKSVAYNPNDYRVDIIVYGANGVIWSQDDWMGSKNSASFWIGTDVTGVHLRIVPRYKVLFQAPVRTFEVQIAY